MRKLFPIGLIGFIVYWLNDGAPGWASTFVGIMLVAGIFSLMNSTNRKIVEKNKRLNPHGDPDDWY